jgi:hypothetical protein
LNEEKDRERERERPLEGKLSAPISPFTKKTKKNYHTTACFTQHSNFSSLAFLFLSSRGRKSKKTLSLSFFRTHRPHKKKAPKALALLLCEKNFVVSRERRTNAERERESQSQRESERESRGIRAREKKRKKLTLPFFNFHLSDP